MAMLHQEIDAVLLERDRVRIGLGHALNHLHVFHVQLEAARGALVGADLAGDNHARLLRQAFERFKHRGRNALHVRHALHGPGAVAKDGEQQLAALAQVVEPSAQGDGLAFMLAEGGNGGDGAAGLASGTLRRSRFLQAWAWTLCVAWLPSRTRLSE